MCQMGHKTLLNCLLGMWFYGAAIVNQLSFHKEILITVVSRTLDEDKKTPLKLELKLLAFFLFISPKLLYYSAHLWKMFQGLPIFTSILGHGTAAY